MRAVQRSPEPEFFDDLRARYKGWNDLDGGGRWLIREALAQDFGRVCAYCQQPCSPPSSRSDDDDKNCNPVRPGRLTDEETIDHFRPRSRFPDLWLDWLNMVYACYRCNQSKCDEWPEFDDQANGILAAFYPSYTPVLEYVSLNAATHQRAAQDFFDFSVDADTGEITPEIVPAKGIADGGQLNDVERSMAHRTILDIDLNDDRSGLGANDRRHLWDRRERHRSLLVRRLNSTDDFDAKVRIMLEFMLPDKPFSGFITSYLMNRFPALARILGHH